MKTHLAFGRHALLVACAAIGLGWTAPASAQVDVDIHLGYPYPPPPHVVYVPPPRVDYVWVPGRWVHYHQPRPYWRDGYWEHKRHHAHPRGHHYGWDKHREPPRYRHRDRHRDDD
ncbi:MAG TPA: hypothetical protein VLC08_10065 [Chitinolyticbacter sp.]|nr:hypothetical protein [Chitinolyticbacter sp.]